MIKLQSFYKYCKEFVIFYPTTQLNRLQTFAVLDSSSDLDTPNLMKEFTEKHKHQFWSRLWASKQFAKSQIGYSYPGMFMRNPSFGIDMPMQSTSTDYTFEVLFVDKDDKTCDESLRRNHSELFDASEYHAKHFIDYLKKAYITTDGELVHELFIGEYEVNELSNRRWARAIQDLNKRIVGTRWAGGADDLYGCLIQIVIPLDQCSTDFSFTPVKQEYNSTLDGSC